MNTTLTVDQRRSLLSHREFFDHELLERVIPFWEMNSLDPANGGYLTCLDREGRPYDSTKYTWLQGRQAWMFSKLYRTVEPRDAWLEVARQGIDFLRSHAVRPDGRLYFSLTADGRPIHIQRKIFSECFYVMALAEYARAAERPDLERESRQHFERVWEWSTDLSLVGRPQLEGQPPLRQLAIPMILLNLIGELEEGRATGTWAAQVDECIDDILLHIDPQRSVVAENVLPDGSIHDSSAGRLLNPGHAIEAGWFLLHWGIRLRRDDLCRTALDMIRWSFDNGWDERHDGLFYFLDMDGHDPVHLEWFMKLWWPHTEAIYATLLAFLQTGNAEDFERYERVLSYTRAHFVDPEHAEWYGYLDRQGSVTHSMKGGPYKGCFHVPRALWLCRSAVDRIV